MCEGSTLIVTREDHAITQLTGPERMPTGGHRCLMLEPADRGMSFSPRMISNSRARSTRSDVPTLSLHLYFRPDYPAAACCTRPEHLCACHGQWLGEVCSSPEEGHVRGHYRRKLAGGSPGSIHQWGAGQNVRITCKVGRKYVLLIAMRLGYQMVHAYA